MPQAVWPVGQSVTQAPLLQTCPSPQQVVPQGDSPAPHAAHVSGPTQTWPAAQQARPHLTPLSGQSSTQAMAVQARWFAQHIPWQQYDSAESQQVAPSGPVQQLLPLPQQADAPLPATQQASSLAQQRSLHALSLAGLQQMPAARAARPPRAAAQVTHAPSKQPWPVGQQAVPQRVVPFGHLGTHYPEPRQSRSAEQQVPPQQWSEAWQQWGPLLS